MRDAPAAGAAAIAQLLAAGVTDVVLSPGSRSAPLALAAAAAEDEGRLRLRVRVDERSAGFLAVGLAKVAGRPAAVVCTSGTAAANLLPAVVEARYSGVPLVVITADRPPELRDRGASQTIRQPGMFDLFVAGSTDLPVPDAGTAPTDWLDQVAGLVALAARVRCPVHINMPFRPPLVAPVIPSGTTPAPARVTSPASQPRPVLDDAPARGLIVAGDIDVWDTGTRTAVADLGRELGWPIVAEATANLAGAPTAVPQGTRLLAGEEIRRRLCPDLVLTIGPFGLDRAVVAMVAASGRHVSVRLRPRTDPPDPLATAEAVLPAVPTAHNEPDPAWLASWLQAAAPVQAAVRAHVRATGEAPPDIGAVAATVWQALTPDDLLFAASSLTVRQVAAFADGLGPDVVANRGANGIDGLVSAAWGAATAWQRAGRGRCVAMLGDLALLHDQNGLWVPAVEDRPDLTYVVADNNGGGIFATLEQGDPAFAGSFDRVFGTPHDRDLAVVFAAAGVPVTRAPHLGALRAQLSAPGDGVRAIVVGAADARLESATRAVPTAGPHR
jgi:2-succinyl-5-enolpyruvyl-6-hydroxy-3-cyclohexene-1-carboxylate synthase